MAGDMGCESELSRPAPECSTWTLRILLAEDDEVSRDIVKFILGQRGHSVTATADGREALTAWEAGPNNYDLLLTDIMMPEMNGTDLVTEIRHREIALERRMPIVALTANVSDKDLSRYRDVGIDDCVAKPIDRERLLSAIRQAWEKSGAAGSRWRQDATEVLVCDTTRLLNDYGHDLGFIRQLAESFSRVFQQDVTRLRVSIAQNDAETARKAAHRVKGSVGNLHGHALRATAETVEKHAAANDMASLPKLVVQMESQFLEFDQVIRSIAEESGDSR